MAHTTTGEGKDNTLLEVVRELEKAVERHMQVLEINIPAGEGVKSSPYSAAQGAVEQKVLDVIHRLGVIRCQVVDGTDLAQRLIKAIGE